MLWLSSEKCGCILSNRHPLPRLMCFFVFGEDSSPLHSDHFRMIHATPVQLSTYCAFHFDRSTYKFGALGDFSKRWKWPEKPRITLSPVWEALVTINQAAEWLVFALVLAKEASTKREHLVLVSLSAFPSTCSRSRRAERETTKWDTTQMYLQLPNFWK